ncbi:hypothetical protein PA7559_37790 [Pseudoalteromonas distincta]
MRPAVPRRRQRSAKEWRIQAYGMNLANKIYVAGQSNPGGNPNNEFLGYPRQYGVRIFRSF